MKLHDHVRSTLRAFACAQLQEAVVESGNFLKWESVWGLSNIDSMIPKTKELGEYEQIYIGRSPLFTFISENIADELQNSFKFSSNANPIYLHSLPGYENLESVADRLIADFAGALPRQYLLTLPMPRALPPLLGDSSSFAFGDSIRLVRTDQTFAQQFDIANDHSGSLSNLLLGRPGWQEDGQALQVSVSGYVGGWSDTLPVRSALSQVRSLLGMLSTSGFEARANYVNKGSVEVAYVHEGQGDDRWSLCRSTQLDHSLSVALERFGPLRYFKSASPDSLKFALNYVAPAFGTGPYAARLRLAAKWLFDSYHSDPLQAFVQTMVCMEILLGENSRDESIGGALRSRAAYLLGSTHEDRLEIGRTVEEAYETRGKIVHTGKDALSVREEDRLSQVQTLCRRIIHKEFELLAAAKGANVGSR